MPTLLSDLNRSAGLAWARPLIAYAFARRGRAPLLLACEVGGEAPDSALLALRDSDRGTPWFSARNGEQLAFELGAVLERMRGEGPGGRFEVSVEKEGLRIGWVSPETEAGA